MPTCNFSLS